MIWFTADLHFWHSRIIKHCQRPFTCVEEMNRTLINNWNSCVREDDTVYVLGDMFWCGRKKAETIIKNLNGAKVLIKGNHDSGNKRWVDMGFLGVYDKMCVFDNMLFNPSTFDETASSRIEMSHYPYYPNKTTIIKTWIREKVKGLFGVRVNHSMGKTLHKRLKDKGNWLLHGHVHNRWRVKGKMINVGVDVWDYKPVSAQEILKILRQGPQNSGHLRIVDTRKDGER